MSEEPPRPQINSAKILVGGGIAGAIFTIGSMLIFLIGIPVLRYVFPAAILVGCGVALVLRFVRHDRPGASWLLSATEQKVESPPEREQRKDDGHSAKLSAAPIRSLWSNA
jgi:sugar phosphate permease